MIFFSVFFFSCENIINKLGHPITSIHSIINIYFYSFNQNSINKREKKMKIEKKIIINYKDITSMIDAILFIH